MVKRARRMTVRKKTTKKGGRAPRAKAHGKSPKSPKVKRQSGNKVNRIASKTDRANQAMKVLMKALKKEEGSE